MGYSIEEIFQSIEYYGDNFPEDFIRELIEKEDESKEFLLNYVKDFRVNIFKHLNDETYVGHIYAVIILSQFREKSLCPLFLDILALPGTKSFELFDTLIPEYGARIIASVYDGNEENILRILNNKKANEYIKAVVIESLKILCINGDISKEKLEDFLIGLLSGKLKDKKHVVVLEILYTAFELKMDKVLDLLKNNCKQGVYPFLSISQVEAEIKLYNEGLYVNEGINDVHNQKIVDALEELKNIFSSLIERDTLKKEAEELQNNIIKEINMLGKKFQKGIKSTSLKEQLESLAKEELYDIGRSLGLKGYYKLNKSDLIDNIFNNYETLISEKINYFDEDRVNELISFLKSSGIKHVKVSNEFRDFFYFESYGLVYPFAEEGTTAFIMPDEVKDILKDILPGFNFRRNIKRNSEIVSLIKGLMEAYGIMEREDIIDRLRLYDINESDEYITNIIKEGVGMYYSWVDKACYVNAAIENFSVVEEIREKMYNYDYKFFTKDELLLMGDDNRDEKVTYIKEFYDRFIEEFVIEKEDLIEIINEIMADVQIVEPDDIVRFMVNSVENKCMDEYDVDDLKESKKLVKELVTKFLENVPLWKYRGRTKKEMNLIK